MVSDYEPTIPEWFHQQFEFDQFLGERRARLEAQRTESIKRRSRYLVGTAVCWVAAALIILISTGRPRLTHRRPLAPPEPSAASLTTPSAFPTNSNVVGVDRRSLPAPLLPEPEAMKEVLTKLGAIEVQGSLYTHTGERYKGALWIREIKRGEEIYLADALFYEIDGPFRLRLPFDSTVHIYAHTNGLDWNGGWGVPIQMPSAVNCSQPGACVLRLEDLMITSAGN